jgi:hypothetical protein
MKKRLTRYYHMTGGVGYCFFKEVKGPFKDVRVRAENQGTDIGKFISQIMNKVSIYCMILQGVHPLPGEGFRGIIPLAPFLLKPS